jgi:hypothetical protein
MFGHFSLDGSIDAVDDASGLEVGGALPLRLGGLLEHRVGVGIGLYIPLGLINRARTPPPGTPYYALLEDRSQVIGIQAALGVKLSRRWSAGIGILALAALKGSLEVTSSAGQFTTVSNQNLTTDFAPILGARWRATDSLRVGATLRFASKSGYDIDITNNLGAILPVTLPELRIAGVAQYDPLIGVVEGAWQKGAFLWSAQLGWEHWSAFPTPTQNPVAGMKPQEPPGFHDTVVPRVSVEWTKPIGDFDVSLRGGTWLALTPAPVETGQQALLDNTRQIFTLGVGLATSRTTFPIHLDAWFQTHILFPRDTPRPMETIHTSGTIVVGGIMLGVDLI